jgi:lysophospholipase L1-like esterase
MRISTRLLWRLAGSAGLLTTLLFLFGFGYAMNDLISPKGESIAVQPAPAATASPGKEADKLQVVAIGDSLTRGVGDETGEGYVGKVKKKLEAASGKQVFVSNNGRNGYRTEDLLAFLNETTIQDLIRHADIVLLTIGGNDLNQFAMTPHAPQTGGDPQLAEYNFVNAEKRLPEATKRLDTILTSVHDLNPKARIIYVGLYNPYIKQDPGGAGTKVLQEWNNEAFRLVSRYPNMALVSTFDLFQFEGGRFLFVDQFHPNAAGYDRISDRVVQALE